MLTVRLLNITGSAVLTTFAKAKVLSWSNRVNGPGRLVFRLPASDPKATDANLQAFKRIKLDRRKTDESGEDETVWYGYIESHFRSPDSPEEIEVQCAGLLQLFRARYTDENEAFTGQGSTEAFGLLTDTNGDGDTGITTGDGNVTSTRDITAAGRKDILGMWEELAQAHGAEFEIDVDGVFHFVPSLGTDKSASVRLTSATDAPGSTVMEFAEGEDGAPLRNKVIGVAPTAGLSSTRQDAGSQATYGVLVEVKVFEEATS